MTVETINYAKEHSSVTTKTILAIPYWLKDKLGRNKVALSSLGNLNDLSNVLSVDELASIFALNDKINQCKASESYNLCDLYSFWYKTRNKNFDVIHSIAKTSDVSKELDTRLSLDKNNVSKEALFKLIDAERDFCVLVVYAGFFDALTEDRFMYSFVKRVLEIFYVYFGLNKCCELPIFGTYIRLLSRLNEAS